MKWMKPSRSFAAAALALILTACGGGGGSENLFNEVENIRSNPEILASLSLTEDSVLGYFEEEDGSLMKVEPTKLTTATRDFCGDGTKVKKQISVSIQKITNETEGQMILAEDVKVDFSACPETVEGLKGYIEENPNQAEEDGLILDGNSLVFKKGEVLYDYRVEGGVIYEIDDGFTYEGGKKLFDLQ